MSPSFVGCAAAASLTGAQKLAQPPQPTEQQKLKERVDALDKQLQELKDKSADAAKERAYVERIRTDTKDFYQQAFSSQMWTLGIMGLILTALFTIAGMFGFNIFDRHMKHAVEEATAQLEKKFDEKLADRLQKLRDSNTAQIKELNDALQTRISRQVDDLELRSSHGHESITALFLAAHENYAAALDRFRHALQLYKIGKARELFDPSSGKGILHDLFVTLERLHKDNVAAETKKELANELYDGFEDELNAEALQFSWLVPIVKERKQASPSGTPPEKDKT